MKKIAILILCLGVLAMAKTAVVYFSATGTTKNVAEKIAKIRGADLFEIKPKVPYTAADLDWRDKKSRSTIECADLEKIRPEMEALDVSAYDTIFIGYPIWWGEAPNIIYTFLDSGKFEGTTFFPFVTSGSSGIGASAKHLAKKYSKSTWKDAKLFNSGVDEKEVKEWK